MRRPMLKLAVVLWGCLLAGPSRGAEANSDPSKDSYQRLIREASMALLREGNQRFASGHSIHPHLELDRRQAAFTEGQQPFATVLTCSDSRVPPELLFDRGVGDVFVVRVAGNVAGPSEMASLEYGVGHLNTPLLVVLGHSKCGAVTAVVNGAALHGHLHALGELIAPAAEVARREATAPAELVPRAIEANVWHVVSEVFRQSAEVRGLVAAGKLQVLGALYDLETGLVKWLGPHPDQKALLGDTKVAVETPHPPPASEHGEAPVQAPSVARESAAAHSAQAATKPGPAPKAQGGSKSASGAKASAPPKATVPAAEAPRAGEAKINPTPGLDLDFGTDNVIATPKKD